MLKDCSVVRQEVRSMRDQVSISMADAREWAESEFQSAQLGDARRTRRLIGMAASFAAHPNASIPQACGGWAQTMGAYRFFAKEELSMKQVLQAHREKTLERCAESAVVLIVQDTTSLNYGSHACTEHLGPIGNTAQKAHGLLLHTSLAVSVTGIPLGVLAAQSWARDPKTFGCNHRRNARSIQEKESCKWLDGFRATQSLALEHPQTRWVHVADREADLYDLFTLASGAADPARATGVLVRVAHNRQLHDSNRRLVEHLRRQPVAGEVEITVPRRDGKPGRKAGLQVRYACVKLGPPQLKSEQAPLTLWVVEAQERRARGGAKRICWRLLTNVEVKNIDDALERLRWYAARWTVEVFHYILKSGCRVEALQLQSRHRLELALAIEMVVAWRVHWLTRVGREQTDQSADVLLSPAEWQVLVRKFGDEQSSLHTPPTLGQAMRWIGRLGGHLGRKNDGPPGVKTLWRGFQRLHDLAEAWSLSKETPTCV